MRRREPLKSFGFLFCVFLNRSSSMWWKVMLPRARWFHGIRKPRSVVTDNIENALHKQAIIQQNKQTHQNVSIFLLLVNAFWKVRRWNVVERPHGCGFDIKNLYIFLAPFVSISLSTLCLSPRWIFLPSELYLCSTHQQRIKSKITKYFRKQTKSIITIDKKQRVARVCACFLNKANEVTELSQNHN